MRRRSLELTSSSGNGAPRAIRLEQINPIPPNPPLLPYLRPACYINREPK